MHWFLEFLVNDIGLGQDLAEFILNFLGVILVASIGLLTPLLTIWLERKVSARMQDRIGPNRTGTQGVMRPVARFGLLQSVADAIKLISKEIIIPAGADRVVFMAAPILMVISVIMIFAVIPFAPGEVGADLSIGALYIVAISSLGTIAILMGGWGSNNKYALLGSFRVIAQLVSYEVPLVLALLVPVLISGTMSTQGIVEAQSNVWFIFMVPVSAVIFFISSTAEVGRQPFDLLEAESEIVAGYNIEYSGMPFGMFYLGEWLHAFLICIITAILFLGGWQGPFIEEVRDVSPLLGLGLGAFYVFAKGMFVYFIHMWIRFTLPRLRIDHLMAFNWKFLVPVSVFNLLVVAFFWKAMPEPTESTLIAELPRALVVLLSNVFLTGVILFVLRNYASRERSKVEALVDETVYSPTLPSTAGTD